MVPLVQKRLDKEFGRLVQVRLKKMGLFLETDGWSRIEEPEDGDIVAIESDEGLLGETVGIWSAGKVLSVHEGGGVVSLEPGVVKGGWRWV